MPQTLPQKRKPLKSLSSFIANATSLKIQIGGFWLWRLEDGSFWLEKEDCEGMQVSKEKNRNLTP